MDTPKFFDGHNDFLLHADKRYFLERNEEGHLDIQRATEGGFFGGFFAVYVPQQGDGGPSSMMKGPILTSDGYEFEFAGPIDHEYALRFAEQRMEMLFQIERDADGRFHVVRTVTEIEECLGSDSIAAILHFEGAEPIREDLSNLETFYEQGLRSLGLVWSRPNIFGEGVPFKYPSSPDTGPGLTERGKELVKELNRLGILIDLSHLNEKGFWDVAALSDAPLVATHTAAHSICTKPRNLTDEQLDAVRESGGVVGVNFAKYDLVSDGRIEGEVSLDEIAKHAEYIAERIGVECVALGSDFEGTRVPDDLADVTGLPKLAQALRKRGFDDASLKKIAHENWIDVLKRTWKP